MTNYSQPELMEEVRLLKADGFMIKNSTASELRDAVVKVIAGEKLFHAGQKPGMLDESSYFFDDFLKKIQTDATGSGYHQVGVSRIQQQTNCR